MSSHHDPLAAFRRPGAKPTGPLTRPPASYRAFAVAGGSAKPVRIEMRPASGVTVARPYSGLTEIVFDRTTWDGVLLVWSNKMAKIKGRNLRPIIEALLAGTCEYVAELHEGERAQEGEPVITRLEINNGQPKPPDTGRDAK